MCFAEPAYLLYLSFQRVIRKKKLFLLILLSLTAAMIVPVTGVSFVEALVREKDRVNDLFPENSYAYSFQGPLIGSETISYIRENICDAGIMASLYNEYVIIHPDTEDQKGRFIDINAADPAAFSMLFHDAEENIRASFTDSRKICVTDRRTARICRLKKGDTVSVLGTGYEIVHISDDHAGSFICIPYSDLDPGLSYQHTVYLFYGQSETDESVISSMRTVFPYAGGSAVPLSETYETKKSSAFSTLFAVIPITLLYMICAVINVSMIRYGEMKINQHDYAVSLALGCRRSELLAGILLENLILIPPAIILDIGVFVIITRLIVLPYDLKISPFTVVCSLTLAFLSSCIAAAAVTRKMSGKSCAAMLKES